jgi:hypothetical protein
MNFIFKLIEAFGGKKIQAQCFLSYRVTFKLQQR